MSSMIEIVTIGPKSIGVWFDECEDIDFNPQYQRTGAAWTIAEQQFLIDSILNEFDIPKLYFADFTGSAHQLNEKNLKYAIIDGKQRLTAIFSFMRNEFSLSNDFHYLRDPSIEIKGKYFDYIQFYHPRIARRFESFLIAVMGVRTDDQALIGELFMRLNRGRPLKGAELRNAAYGPVADIIRKLSEHAFFSKKVSFPQTRLQNFDAASKILLLELAQGFTDVKKSNLDFLISPGAFEIEDINQAYERASQNLDHMFKNFDDRDSTLKSAGLFPVIYQLSADFPEEIEKIKQAIRHIYTRIRYGDPTDSIINEFKFHNRNTNDKGSLFARYAIINSFMHLI